MINFFKDIKNIDESIIKIMRIGLKYSVVLCLFFTYILYFYSVSPVSHVAFDIGYLGVKCSLMFFVSFLVGAIAADKLKKGFNIITITVEDEELEPTEYFITVYKQPSITKIYTSLEDILAEEKLEEHVYFVTSDYSIKITKEVLKKINENKKDFYYNFINEDNTILYQLIIPTGKFTDEINPSFVMEIDNPLTYTGNLPSGISVMLYAGNLYGDETEFQVYTYDEVGMYTELTTALKLVNGYLNFTTNGEKSYTFSLQNLMGGNGFNLIDNLPMIFFGALIIFLFAYIIIKKKKGKKEVKSNEPLY